MPVKSAIGVKCSIFSSFRVKLHCWFACSGCTMYVQCTYICTKLFFLSVMLTVCVVYSSIVQSDTRKIMLEFGKQTKWIWIAWMSRMNKKKSTPLLLHRNYDFICINSVVNYRALINLLILFFTYFFMLPTAFW